jgi:PAS domain S-box-containing protein
MLTGILYLENNIFSNMFTQERLEVVKILCSQIAISLENAGLFSFLEESEQRYRQLYENIIDMVILVDQDKKILLTNPLFYYVFGIQEADRKDLMFLDWVHPEDVHRVTSQMLAQDGDSDFVRDFNFRMIHADNVIEVECNTKRIRKEDSIQFQMVIRDITKRKRLEQNLLNSLQDVHKARVGTILGLAKLAEYRDKDTGSHLERIREYARIIAIEMGKRIEYKGYITPQYIDDLYLSSILHDIGKVGIPDSILLKPGKLSAEEFELMKRHTTYGGEALHSVEEQTEGQSFLALGKAIAFHHHERWDGSGYPDGLKEDEIPLSTRIVALVDVYDALTSKRSYKEAFSHETAREMIISNRATHFAPDVVDAFLQSEDQFIRIREELLSDFPDDIHSTIH